ncbi:hypothetical protein KLP28_16315 [Nocardioidaceae bacterium]|nr:hypothetical protein KLP28_16315 [Nocardioidaceae bacterium]
MTSRPTVRRLTLVPLVVLALWLPLLPVTAQAADAPSSGSTFSATPPGARSAVVRDLRRALRAADANRRIPAGTEPGRVDLVGDTRTLSPACTADPGETRHRICARGRTGSDHTVVVLGNSKMAMWLAGLEYHARREGVRLVPFIKYGCAPYMFEMWRKGSPWPECSNWRDWALRKIKRMKPDLVVTAAHTWLEFEGPNGGQMPKGRAWDRTWQTGVERTARRLGRSADRVVVLGDALTRRDNPGDCARRPGPTMRLCEVTMVGRTRQLLRLTERGATSGGAEFLDMNAFTCIEDRCPIVAGGSYVFRDKWGHLTATYSRQISRAFATSIGLRR